MNTATGTNASAPQRFAIPLKRNGLKKLGIPRGTRAERAILRLWFLASGFDEDGARSAVLRWTHATNKGEFQRKINAAVRWLETLDVDIKEKP